MTRALSFFRRNARRLSILSFPLWGACVACSIVLLRASDEEQVRTPFDTPTQPYPTSLPYPTPLPYPPHPPLYTRHSPMFSAQLSRSQTLLNHT